MVIPFPLKFIWNSDHNQRDIKRFGHSGFGEFRNVQINDNTCVATNFSTFIEEIFCISIDIVPLCYFLLSFLVWKTINYSARRNNLGLFSGVLIAVERYQNSTGYISGFTSDFSKVYLPPILRYPFLINLVPCILLSNIRLNKAKNQAIFFAKFLCDAWLVRDCTRKSRGLKFHYCFVV